MKPSFTKLSLLALPVFALTACQDFEPFSEAEVAESQTIREFTNNFEARYGKIDPNHTWGFGPIVDNSETRAVVANKNEWMDKYHMQVPGWPDNWIDKDGKAHVGYDGKGYHNEGNQGSNQYDENPSNVPAGDVTDEEIQYVSWWFRTHRYPTSLNLHWSDFYIQEISADNDRDANGNKVTEVAEYQQQSDGSWKRARTEEVSKFTIDQLRVKTMNSSNLSSGSGFSVSDLENAGYDHIYNFNSGASNTLFEIPTLSMSKDTYDWGDDTTERMKNHTNKRLIAYYQSSGTEDWAAHYSNDEVWRSNYVDKSIWVMVHLHFIGNSGRVYDGYYLGFDYAFHKYDSPNKKYQIRKPDGYYSNWILKLSPGIPLVENNPYTRRIMCEDLGNTLDLDFDDVVFDATLNMDQNQLNSYTSGDVDVTITLQAAGGTMPLWVGRNPNKDEDAPYEAHSLFHVSTSTPVNVANGADAPIVKYHTTIQSKDLNDIGIWVKHPKIGWLELPKSAVGNYQGPGYDKSAPVAPQKFAVPPTVLWLKETKQIETAYPNFKDWVGAENGAYKVDSDNAWYLEKNQGNKANLCGTKSEVPYSTSPTPGQITDNGLVGTTSSYANVKTYDVIPLVNNKDWGSLTIEGDCTYNRYTEGYTFNAGLVATIVPVAKDGYEFDCWSYLPNAPQDGYSLTVDGMKYVMAYFKPVGSTPNPPAGGGSDVGDGGLFYNPSVPKDFYGISFKPNENADCWNAFKTVVGDKTSATFTLTFDADTNNNVVLKNDSWANLDTKSVVNSVVTFTVSGDNLSRFKSSGFGFDMSGTSAHPKLVSILVESN